MLIRLDRHLCAEFLEEGIIDVNVDIIHAGCAGSKIVVMPRTQSDDRIASEMHNGVRSWIIPELAGKLDGAQIARAKGKYYLVSEHIQSRCGCGTSFSFEKKSFINFEKINKIKAEFSQLYKNKS